MGTIKSISIREQGRLSDEDLSFINSLGVEPTDESSEKRTDTCLGLNKDGFVSYFVGATWLKEGECSLSVLPKFKHLDFMSILYETIHCGVHPDYFKSVYKVDYGKPQIEEPALQSVLTPIIVTHYLCVIKRLLEKGLKRNYVLREENLN